MLAHTGTACTVIIIGNAIISFTHETASIQYCTTLKKYITYVKIKEKTEKLLVHQSNQR